MLSHVPGNGHHSLHGSGGLLENAQNMAAHESPRTTKFYHRTDDKITIEEVEKIVI
jgi:hypothetical protein